MSKTKSVKITHLSGLPEIEERKSIYLQLYGDRLEFNKKQIIPLTRVNGCEITTTSLQVKGHPIQNAFGIGLLSAIAGGFLTGLVTGDGEIMFFICAIVGAITGAIVGNKAKKRLHSVLSIDYMNVHGDTATIQFAEHHKTLRTELAHIADSINKSVGYTPLNRSLNNTNQRHEI